MRIELRRAQGGQLVIDDAEVLALHFFGSDDSAVGDDSYDEHALRTDPSAPFTQEDAAVIRKGMRLDRLKRPTWDWLVNESPRGFHTAIDPSWDLVELSDADWGAAKAEVAQAFYDFMGTNRGAPVATKFLHYKRRHLFPILDSAVLDMTSLRIPEMTTSDNPKTIERSRRKRADAAATACEQIRGYALANRAALKTIQQELRARGIDRTLARILDALLWSAHPASLPSHSGVIRWSKTA